MTWWRFVPEAVAICAGSGGGSYREAREKLQYEVIVFTVFQFLCFVASSFLLHDEMLIDDVVWPIEFESFVSSQLRKKKIKRV